MQVFRVCVRLLLLQEVPGAALEGRAQEQLQEIKSADALRYDWAPPHVID